MNKAYNRINWENYPSLQTPLNEQNLNEMDGSLDEIDNRVITLDTTKATKTEVSTLFKEVEYDGQTGIIKFTRKNGAIVTIDTPMEKIALNIYYDPVTEKLMLPLADGTQWEVDLSRLITEFEFVDSDTIAISVSVDGKVTSIVKEGSIEEKHLRPDYLADIKLEAAKAQLSESNAAISAASAEEDRKLADSYARGGTGVRDGEDTDNAKYYSEQAKVYADTAEAVSGIGIMTEEKAGIGKPDGTSLTVDPDGTMHVIGNEGTIDYNELENKPSINSVTVEGDKTSKDYGIPEVVELTWNEYSALPESKKTDDVVYMINDKGTDEVPLIDINDAINGVVLWENPNPTASFPGQNGIMTDNLTANYDYVEVVFAHSDTTLGGENMLFTTGKVEMTNRLQLILPGAGIYTRAATFEGNAFAFTDCNKAMPVETTVYNNIIIPRQIIGYKKAEFNPINGILPPAEKVTYNNEVSKLTSTDVQNALDELNWLMSLLLPKDTPIVNGSLRVGSHINLFEDNEGGNIRIISPTDFIWEMDAFDGGFRIFNYNPGIPGIVIDMNGRLKLSYWISGLNAGCPILFNDGGYIAHGPGALLQINPGRSVFLLGKLENMSEQDPLSASLLFYNIAPHNWAGLGADVNGFVWLRTGVSGDGHQFLFDTAGNFLAENIAQTSSIRYKENVEDLTDEEAEKILEVRPVSFDMKASKWHSYGVIAEEIVDVIPDVVSRNGDGEVEGVNYNALVPHLIKMVQKQQKQIDALQEEIELLKRKGD